MRLTTLVGAILTALVLWTVILGGSYAVYQVWDNNKAEVSSLKANQTQIVDWIKAHNNAPTPSTDPKAAN